VSALSKNFVKDPREVVKPGDIVTVKVLEVDIPRKRISLTLRLDDEVGGGARTPGSQGNRGAGGQGGRGAGGQGRGPGGQGRGPGGQGRGPGGGQGGQGGQGGRGGNRGSGAQGQGQGRGGSQKETPMDETSLADAFRKAGFTVR
jgi:uncharacterized protein